MYEKVDIPVPFVGDWCGKYAERKDPERVSKDAAFANLGEEYAVNSRRHYYANVTFIDDQIGQIIQILKEKGMYENAIICYTADHGDMLSLAENLCIRRVGQDSLYHKMAFCHDYTGYQRKAD